MGTKLKEGQVVKSASFVRGNLNEYGVVKVGNYNDQWIHAKIYNTDFYSNGIPAIDEERVNREYLILKVHESQPHVTIGNRMSSYENSMVAIELNEDGTYNEDNQKISFSTCYVYTGAIKEEDIQIVREMKKTYI
jgi:hypothetical protein